MNRNRYTFIFCLLIIISLFVSCQKEETHGQGGYDTLSAPVSYDDIILTEETSVYNEPTLEYTVYRVKKDDYIGNIAKQYGVTEDTIISVNGVKQSRLIQIGDYFKIPSMPGIMYTVRADGETVESICSKYEIASDKCARVNSLEQKVALKAGTTLFLPDAELDWVTRQEINGDLFTRPLRRGYYFSSYYGWRSNPFSGKRTFHGGIDMACPAGTPIYAALVGTVSRAGYDTVYGNFVEVKHHSGYKTLYAHMTEIRVKKGQSVTTGTIVGTVGTTGLSTGNHLHFAVYKNGKSMDPRRLWK